MPKIEIDQTEIVEVFKVLGRLNTFLHQPMHFDDVEYAQRVSAEIYPALSKAYYHTVWNWLPTEIQKQIEDR